MWLFVRQQMCNRILDAMHEMCTANTADELEVALEHMVRKVNMLYWEKFEEVRKEEEVPHD